MSLAFKAHHKLNQESSKRDTCLIRLLGHASVLETILDSNREQMDCDTVEVIAPQDLMAENDYPQLPILTDRSYDSKADGHSSSESFYSCSKSSLSGSERDDTYDKRMTFIRVRYIDSLDLGAGITNICEDGDIGNGFR